MGHLLFGFSGRTNRAKMWLFLLIALIAWTVVIIAAVAMIGPEHFSSGATLSEAETQKLIMSSMGAVALVCIFLLIALWVSLAVVVKRLHDRNKSGWWVLVFLFLPGFLSGLGNGMNMQAGGGGNAAGGVLALVALGINIWAFVELYCLRGTVGDNRYGPDPLGHG